MPLYERGVDSRDVGGAHPSGHLLLDEAQEVGVEPQPSKLRLGAQLPAFSGKESQASPVWMAGKASKPAKRIHAALWWRHAPDVG